MSVGKAGHKYDTFTLCLENKKSKNRGALKGNKYFST